jgi:hypothetical protein
MALFQLGFRSISSPVFGCVPQVLTSVKGLGKKINDSIKYLFDNYAAAITTGNCKELTG